MKSLKESILDVDKTINDVKIMGDINGPMVELFDSINKPDIKNNVQKLISVLKKSDLIEELDSPPTANNIQAGYYMIFAFNNEYEICSMYELKQSPLFRNPSEESVFEISSDCIEDLPIEYERYYAEAYERPINIQIKAAIRRIRQLHGIGKSNIFIYLIKPNTPFDDLYESHIKPLKDKVNSHGLGYKYYRYRF